MRRPSWVGGRTGTRDLAKISNPDSSTAASIVQRLPWYIRALFIGTSREVLIELTRQLLVSASGAGTRGGLVCPAEQWMATRFSRSRATIVSYVKLLVKLGCLRITHRRPIGEVYQSNIYTFGTQMIAALQRWRKKEKSNDSACQVELTLGYCKETKSPVHNGPGLFREEKIDSDRLSPGSDLSGSGPSEPQTLGDKGREAYEAAMTMFKRLASAPQPS